MPLPVIDGLCLLRILAYTWKVELKARDVRLEGGRERRREYPRAKQFNIRQTTNDRIQPGINIRKTCGKLTA